MFFGLAPDRWWLWWVRGATARGPFANPERAFDPDGEFIARYATRRQLLEKEQALRVQPEPVQPEPVQPEPVQPEPVQPEPVQPVEQPPAAENGADGS
jgi:cell division protein FtsN